MHHSSLSKLAAPTAALTLVLVALVGCADGANCSITTNNAGEAELRCQDGTVFVIPDGNTGDVGERGTPGAPGRETTPCTIRTGADGSRSLTCGDTSVVLDRESVACEDGFPGSLYIYPERSHDDQYDGSSNFALELLEMTDCTALQGNLTIEDYDQATLPPRIEALTRIGGGLLLRAGGALHDDFTNPRFPQLQEVEGYVEINSNPYITSLENVFPALERVGDLYIMGNSQLMTTDGFPRLARVGAIDILDNLRLEVVEGFGALAEALSIHISGNNPALQRIGSFDALETIGTLDIQPSTTLTDLGRYPVLRTHASPLNFTQHSLLPALPEFPALEYAHSLRINENSSLAQIPSFPRLDLHETGTLVIHFNNAMDHIGDFPALQHVAEIEFKTNADLLTIGSFDSLETVARLWYFNNDILVDGGSFPALREVTQRLDIDDTGLPALPDFPNLESVGNAADPHPDAGLYITRNHNLASTSGFSAIIDSALDVSSNLCLPDAEVFNLETFYEGDEPPHIADNGSGIAEGLCGGL